MIDFDTATHHGALCVIAFYLLTMFVNMVSISLEGMDIVLELILHIFQFALTIAGLIAFYWTWNEKKKKNRKKPL